MSTIRGTVGDDVIGPGGVSAGVTGGPPSILLDYVYGSGGSDVIDGGAGWDTVDYSELAGPVGIAFNAADATAVVGKGALGTDTLLGVWYRFFGTAGADSFIAAGGAFRSSLAAVELGAGDDTVDGGALARVAEIRYLSSPAGVLVDLGSGTAQDGWGGTDSLRNVWAVQGSEHADTLLGSGAEETFRAWLGSDVYDGRGGFDALSFFSLSGVVVSLTGIGSGTATKTLGGQAAGTDTFAGIEAVEGTTRDDTLIGTDAAGGGGTLLRGGYGDDRVEGRGNAANIVDYTGAPSGVFADLAAGYALGEGTDTLVSVVALRGSFLSDTVAGSAAADVLDGGAGADNLAGGGGGDTLLGGADGDFLFGQAGDDSLAGGAGADALVGEAGNDTLDGGAGSDVLLGGAGNDTYLVDGGLEVVDEGSLAAYAAYGFGGFDTILSTANFFWDLYSVGEVLRIAEGAADPAGTGTTAVGGVFNNTLVGNAATNVLFGRGGSDTYRAGDGVDWISLSTLGVPDAPGYTARGVNTIVVDPRQSGPVSYDIVFEYIPGRDRLDVSAYDYASPSEVLARGADDGLGNCYFVLGDGLDYLYLVGVTKAQVQAGDFIV